MMAISVGTIGLTPVTNYGVSTKIAHTGFSIESPPNLDSGVCPRVLDGTTGPSDVYITHVVARGVEWCQSESNEDRD